MATIDVTYGDGERLLVDNDIATEVTLNKILENLAPLSAELKAYVAQISKSAGKSDQKIADALNNSIKNGKDNTNELKESLKEDSKNLLTEFHNTAGAIEELAGELKNQQKKADKFAQENERVSNYFIKKIGDNMSFLGSMLQKFITSAFALGSTSIGFFLTSVQNLGTGLKDLTDVGGAFGDNLLRGSVSTIDNITSLNQLGLTTDQAVTILKQFSKSAAVLGQSALPQLNRQFLQITNFGVSLGIALDDATQFFQEDLAFRTNILLRDRINQFETARASEQGIKNLRMFSTLLGRSADDLRAESRTIIDSDKAFQQLLVTLGPMGENVLNATESLFAGLKSVDLPDEVLSGILQVATIGSEAASDFINALGPFAPELRDELTGLGMAIRSGSITMDQVQGRVLSVLDSVSSADPGQLKQLVAALDNDLQGAAQALINFSVDAENARKNFRLGEDITTNFSDVQNALTEFENFLQIAQGGLSTFKNSLVLGAEEGLESFVNVLGRATDENSKFTRLMKVIGTSLGEVFNRFAQTFLNTDFVNNFDQSLVTIQKGIAALGERLINFTEDVLGGFFNKNNELNLIGGLTNFITSVFLEGILLAIDALIIAIPAILGAIFTDFRTIALLGGAFLVMLGSSIITAAFQAGVLALFLSAQPAMITQWTALMAQMRLTSGAGMLYPAKGMMGRAAMAGGGFALGGMAVNYVGGITEEAVGGPGTTAGNITNTATDVLAGAAFGAAVGSVVPVIGTAVGAAVGAGIGLIKDLFDDDGIGTEKKEPPKVAHSEVNNTTHQSTVRVNRRSGTSLAFLEAATDTNNRGDVDDMTMSEVADIDRMSDEAKLLTLMLAENKSQTKKLDELANKRV